MSWARDIAEDETHTLRRDYPAFKTALNNLYSDRNLKARNEDKLSALVQTKSAAAYAAEFQSLVDPLNFCDNAKRYLFHKGLRPEVKDAIATIGRATTFALLVDQAIGIDQRKHQNTLVERKAAKPPPTTNRNHQKPNPQPQLDPCPHGQKRPASPNSSEQERTRRKNLGLCWHCEEPYRPGHKCRNKPKENAVTASTVGQTQSVNPEKQESQTTARPAV